MNDLYIASSSEHETFICFYKSKIGLLSLPVIKIFGGFECIERTCVNAFDTLPSPPICLDNWNTDRENMFC
jgi:hypothetical protein